MTDCSCKTEARKNGVFEGPVGDDWWECTCQPKTVEVSEFDMVFYTTFDPNNMFMGTPVPAGTTLIHKVCDGNTDKFNEALRLLELFVQNAIERTHKQYLSTSAEQVSPERNSPSELQIHWSRI